METKKSLLLLIAVMGLAICSSAQNNPTAAASSQQQIQAQVDVTTDELIETKIRVFKAETGKMVVTEARYRELEAAGKMATEADRQRYFVVSNRQAAISELDAEIQRLRAH